MEEIKKKNQRRLIYVDASGFENNSKYKISMYDPLKNKADILELIDINDNNIAEAYAIFNAIFYIKKHNYQNCHILCDNKTATEEKYIVHLCNKYKIGISWIPREANITADKVAKLEATLKEKDFNVLEMMIDLVMSMRDSNTDKKETKDTETLKLKIEQLTKSINDKNTKIKNQTIQINNLRK